MSRRWLVFLLLLLVVLGVLVHFVIYFQYSSNIIVLTSASSLLDNNTWDSESQTFKQIIGVPIYTYSAYVEDRAIRILGFSVLQSQERNVALQCILFFLQTSTTSMLAVSVDATLEIIPEHHSEKYSACYIKCKIPHYVSWASRVSVVVAGNVDTAVGNSLSISKPTDKTFCANFTVCVSPMHNGYDEQYDLVEMIELNRIFGADRFHIYNYSIGPHAEKVLQYYVDTGIVKMINWPMPTESVKHTHYYGQMTAINDCLYRNRHTSRYIVVQDMDEFIVPRGPSKTWAQVIDRRKKSNPKAATFQFRNVFFRKKWVDDLDRIRKLLPDNYKQNKYMNTSVVLRNVQKENRVFDYNIRSKCIVDPLGVETLGIHNIWKTSNPIDQVPLSDGFLQHYREWNNPNDSMKRIYDDTMVTKFGSLLLDKVKSTWMNISKKGV